jgi:carboxylesterase type B
VITSYYDVARGSGYSILEGVLQWGPVLDDEQLPVQPMAAVAARTLAPVDVLVGHNTDEVATFLDQSYYAAEYPFTVYETVLFSIFGIRGASAVKAHYARYDMPAGVEQLDLIMTDFWFRCAKEAVAGAAAATGAAAWSYRFHHNVSFGPLIWGPLFGLPQCVRKVCHTAELVFVFGNAGEWSFTPEEVAFSDTLIDMWTNFAHTGDPSTPPPPRAPQAAATATSRRALRRRVRRALQHAGLQLWRDDGRAAQRRALPVWPAFTNDTRLSLVLSEDWEEENSTETCAFWDGIGYTR